MLTHFASRGRHRDSWLIAGSGFGALVLILVLAATVHAQGGCLNPGIDTEAPQAMATLDTAHPVVEQVVTLTIEAEALPPDLAADAARLLVRLSYPTRPELPAAPAAPRGGADPPDEPEPDPLTAAVTVTFIDMASGVADARIGLAESTINDSFRLDHPGIVLDCPRQHVCERTYTVRIALQDHNAAEPLPIRWTTAVTIDYSGLQPVPCVPPGPNEIAAGQPSLVSARSRGDATIHPQREDGRNVARHVTIESTSGGTTVARLSVRGANWPDPDWRMWVRIIPDAGTAPVIEGLIGRPWDRLQDGVVDFPVAADCPARGPCERGYWLVMQSIPAAKGSMPDGPPSIGRFTWRMDVISVGSPESPPAGLSARLDDRHLPPDAIRRVDAAQGSLHVGRSDQDRVVPLTITLPRDDAEAISDEMRLAGHIVVHATGDASGAHLDYRLAGEESGASNVGNTTNSGSIGLTLIGHPLDACVGPTCDIELRLRLDSSSGSTNPRVDIDWTATLVGFPVGTSVTAGPPTYATPDPVPLDLSRLVAMVAPFAAAVALAILLARSARRLRARAAS